MKGKYLITIKNNVLRYQFEIRRNITIIKGDSATGKTTRSSEMNEYYKMDIKYDILEELGVLSKSAKGWRKELNLITVHFD